MEGQSGVGIVLAMKVPGCAAEITERWAWRKKGIAERRIAGRASRRGVSLLRFGSLVSDCEGQTGAALWPLYVERWRIHGVRHFRVYAGVPARTHVIR